MLKRPRHNEEGGTILVLTAMLLVVFLGMAALAVDAAMAWSNRRVAQGIADTSVMAALQAVPRTMSVATATSQARSAAEALASSNNAANGTSVTVGAMEVVPQPGQVDVELAVSVVSATPFGTAIGAGDSFTMAADAEGRIDVYLPGQVNADGALTMRLFPLGLSSGASGRMLCRVEGGVACPPGSQGAFDVIGMRRTDTTCTDADETTTRNMANGVDHLIGFDVDFRDEREACELRLAAGHEVSLPTTSRLIPSGRVPYSPGFSSLLGGPPLWDYLIDGLPGACEKSGYDPTLLIDALTERMRACLQSGTRPLFTGMAIDDRRLGWGVFTQPGGTEVRYTGSTIFWVHSVIDAAGQTITPTAGPYRGAVVFRLEPNMLPGGFAGYVPLSFEGLEFTLTD